MPRSTRSCWTDLESVLQRLSDAVAQPIYTDLHRQIYPSLPKFSSLLQSFVCAVAQQRVALAAAVALLDTEKGQREEGRRGAGDK